MLRLSSIHMLDTVRGTALSLETCGLGPWAAIPLNVPFSSPCLNWSAQVCSHSHALFLCLTQLSSDHSSSQITSSRKPSGLKHPVLPSVSCVSYQGATAWYSLRAQHSPHCSGPGLSQSSIRLPHWASNSLQFLTQRRVRLVN